MEAIFVFLLFMGVVYAVVKILMGAAKLGFYLLIAVIIFGAFAGCLQKLKAEETTCQYEHTNQLKLERNVPTVLMIR